MNPALKHHSTMSSRAPRRRKIIRDAIMGITKPAIKRIATKAGLERIGNSVSEESRAVLKVTLENLLSTVVTITQHMQRKTVSLQDVITALKIHGISWGGALDAHMRMYQTTGKRLASKIKNAQAAVESFLIPKAAFRKLTREISQDFSDELRFSSDALLLIQIAIEAYMLKLFQDCLILVNSRGDKTLSWKDLMRVRSIRGERA